MISFMTEEQANFLWNVLDNVVLESDRPSDQAHKIDYFLSELQTYCAMQGGGFDRKLQVVIDDEFSVNRHYVS